MRKLKLVLYFLTISIVFTGCIKIPIGDGESLKISKDALTISDKDGQESTIHVDKNDESFNVSTDDGEEWEASFGENIALPKDFPKNDLPLPDDVTIISSQKINLEDGEASIVVYTSEVDSELLSEIYIKHFEKSGFENIEHGFFGEITEQGFIPITAMKGDTIFVVQIMSTGEDEVQVSLMYGKENE